MYKIQHVREDPNRFTNTAIGVDGALWFVDNWMFGDYNTTATIHGQYYDDDGALRGGNILVKDKLIDWLPLLRPGYYNIMSKPWRCVWAEQSGARQYKVGLNQKTVRVLTKGVFHRRDDGLHARLGRELDFAAMAAIYEERTEYQPLGRALSMIRRRQADNSQCALSASLAVEKGPLGFTYLVHRASRLVGLVHKGEMLVDSSFNHPDLKLMEYKHEEIKKFIPILAATA